MANQTVTTNLTLDQVISNGLADGQNITINAGSVVTVDGPSSVLVGQVTINEGELFLDGANATDPIVYVGENAEEINVNGAGVLRSSLGWWDFPTTSNGTAGQTFDCSTYFTASPISADVFAGVWVETGRRINYDSGTGVAPKVGDWLYAVSDQTIHGRIVEVSGDGVTGYVVVRFLTGALADNDAIEIHSLQDNNGPDLQISWTADANGADVLESGVFQEFGNARQNAINNLANIGAGIAGFGFDQAHGSNTLTFGDGVNGFIPPNGARIRVPMVHFATATLADFGAGNASWVAGNANKHNIETVNGGDCYLDGVSCGSVWFEDNLGGQFQASYCAANGNFGCYATIGRPTYDHCIWVGEIEGDTRSRSRSVPPIVDLVSGADVRDCLGLFTNDAAETTQLGGQTSLNVNLERCIQLSTANTSEWEMIRVNGFTIDDMVVIGCGAYFTTSAGGDIKNLRTQRNILGGVGGGDQVTLTSSTSQVKLTGWEILNGSCPDDSKIVIIDSNNIEVRCFHFIDRKFDNEDLGGTQGEEFAAVSGLSNDILFARCWQNGGTPNEFILAAAGTTKNLTVQNCSAEYTGEIEPDGINTLIRGLHGGSGSLGSGTGIETDYPGTAGAMCGDCFRSDTQGLIYYRAVPGTDEYPVTILAGAPRFTKDGDVDVSPGDQWEVDMGYAVRGHTGFNGTIASVRNAGTTNTVWDWTAYLDVELQYDTGSGYNGTWIDVTDTAAMAAILFNVAGTRFKFRFTATAAQTNIQAFTLRTTTTLAAQSANYYPLDVVPFTLSGIVPGSRLLIRAAGDAGAVNNGDVLLSATVTTDPFVYEHGFQGELPVNIRVRKATSAPFYKTFETVGLITSDGGSAFVTQTLDQ